LKEFLIGSKVIFEEQSANSVSNHEHTSVGRVFAFLCNSQVRVFENKKFKELPGSGFYNFKEIYRIIGVQVFEKVRPDEHIYAYTQSDRNQIPATHP
jgi:hypothetical protein